MPTDVIGIRIPELQPFSTYGTIAVDDLMIVWLKAFNRTCYVPVATMIQIMGGGGGTGVLVQKKDREFYIVPDNIADGITEAHLPQYAGRLFYLDRDGFPILPDQYEILDAGGFRLTRPNDFLQPGAIYELQFYELVATSGNGNPSTSISNGFLTGFVEVTANKTLTKDDANKCIQLRGGTGSSATQFTVTLPNVSDLQECSLFVIEAQINNDKQHSITTQGGQNIYMNGTSWPNLYIGKGEVMYLLVKADGYYVINDFGKYYLDIGRIYDSYNVAFNELRLDGSTVSRTDYPRLWQVIQAFSYSLVSDTLWTDSVTGGYYKGCFSTGDGSSSFRLPDLRNQFIRGLKDNDTERQYNYAGGFQDQQVIAHNHANSNYNRLLAVSAGSNTVQNVDSNNSSGSEPNLLSSSPIVSIGGVETRPVNIGLYKVIRF